MDCLPLSVGDELRTGAEVDSFVSPGEVGKRARDYPAVTVDPDVLYGDEGNVLTLAGVAAGIDLCLHIIRTDAGAAAANQRARTLVAGPHRTGGQAQYVDRLTLSQRTGAPRT